LPQVEEEKAPEDLTADDGDDDDGSESDAMKAEVVEVGDEEIAAAVAAARAARAAGGRAWPSQVKKGMAQQASSGSSSVAPNIVLNDMAVWRDLKRTLIESGDSSKPPDWFLDLAAHTHKANAAYSPPARSSKGSRGGNWRDDDSSPRRERDGKRTSGTRRSEGDGSSRAQDRRR